MLKPNTVHCSERFNLTLTPGILQYIIVYFNKGITTWAINVQAIYILYQCNQAQSYTKKRACIYFVESVLINWCSPPFFSGISTVIGYRELTAQSDRKKRFSYFASKLVCFSYAYNAVTGSFKINKNMYNTFPILKKMPINICSNLFDVSISNVFVMYSFWVSILNYLYNTFELNE